LREALKDIKNKERGKLRKRVSKGSVGDRGRAGHERNRGERLRKGKKSGEHREIGQGSLWVAKRGKWGKSGGTPRRIRERRPKQAQRRNNKSSLPLGGSKGGVGGRLR